MSNRHCVAHSTWAPDYVCVRVWDITSPSPQRRAGFHVILGHPEHFTSMAKRVRVLVCPAKLDHPSEVTPPDRPATPQDAQWASALLMAERPALFKEFAP